jgi:hypothetical protein
MRGISRLADDLLASEEGLLHGVSQLTMLSYMYVYLQALLPYRLLLVIYMYSHGYLLNISSNIYV